MTTFRLTTSAPALDACGERRLARAAFAMVVDLATAKVDALTKLTGDGYGLVLVDGELMVGKGECLDTKQLSVMLTLFQFLPSTRGAEERWPSMAGCLKHHRSVLCRTFPFKFGSRYHGNAISAPSGTRILSIWPFHSSTTFRPHDFCFTYHLKPSAFTTLAFWSLDKLSMTPSS